MLSVKDIPLIVFRLLKKERQGSTVSVSDINRFIELASYEEAILMKQQMELTKDITDSMRTFTVSQTLPVTGSNYITLDSLSNEYLKLLGVQRRNGTRWEDCDEITQLEYQDRISNSVTLPTVDYPISYIIGNALYILPQPETGSSIRLSYLRHPETAYIDAYINTGGEIVYLADSEVVSESNIDSDFVLYGWDGVALNIVGGNYTSVTKDFEWPDNSNRISILKRVLVMCGVSVPDTLAIQYGGQQ